jgi:anti-sigma B factor antagonist
MTTIIAVAERDGLAPEGLRSLRIAGPLTVATAPELRRRLRDETTGDDTRLMLDLQAVTGLDASGVAVLLEASRIVDARHGGHLTVRVNSVVMRALKDTGTLTAFKICNG